ncbi:MAG: GerAB/ArcD/ProY family transporter [Patescibacteria group bacterium]
MADTPQHNISPGQLTVFLISAQLGLGIFGLPRHAVERLGHAGWWLVLAVGFLTFLGVMIVTALCGRFQSSILTVHRRVFGTFIGTAFNLLLLAALFGLTVTHFALYIQVMKVFFFRITPFTVVAAILIAPVVYLAAKGLKTAARFDTFVYIAILALIGMMLAASREASWTFLQPLLSFKTTAFLQTMFRLTFGFVGFELLLVVYPWVREKAGRAALAAVGITALVVTTYTVFTIAFFGEEFVIKQVFPLLNLVRTLQAPVIERLDIYFIMIWLPAMGSSAGAYLIATQLAAVEIFPRLPYRILLAILVALVFLAVLPITRFDRVLVLTNYTGTAGMFVIGILWPALVWLAAALRGVRG